MFKLFKRKSYDEYQKELDMKLEAYKADLQKQQDEFKEIIDRCNSKDPDVAFQASIELARFVGVDEDKIIHNDEELEKFFMG